MGVCGASGFWSADGGRHLVTVWRGVDRARGRSRVSTGRVDRARTDRAGVCRVGGNVSGRAPVLTGARRCGRAACGVWRSIHSRRSARSSRSYVDASNSSKRGPPPMRRTPPCVSSSPGPRVGCCFRAVMCCDTPPSPMTTPSMRRSRARWCNRRRSFGVWLRQHRGVKAGVAH